MRTSDLLIMQARAYVALCKSNREPHCLAQARKCVELAKRYKTEELCREYERIIADHELGNTEIIDLKEVA